MTLLTKNSLGAERERGLRFVEKFRNTEEVVNNGGTITGAPVINNGATFDGANDSLKYAEHNEVSNNELSVFIKVKIANTASSSIFSHYDTGANERGWLIRLVSNKMVVYLADITEAGTGYSKKYDSSIIIVDGEEHLIGFVWNGTTLNLYVDGVKDTSVDKDKDDSITELYQSKSSIAIGSQLTSESPSAFFEGQGNDARIFKEALTAQEILDYYNNDVFNYEDKADLNLPMGMAQHDPSYDDPTQLLVDGDMEAVGTGDWAAVDSTLSKVSSTLGGGTQALRVTATGATYWASQAILTIGKTYRVTGYTRSDGSEIPKVLMGGVASLWIGTNSTSWQYFDVVLEAKTSTTFFLGSTGSSGYVEFNEVTVTDVKPHTLDVSGNGNHAQLGDGSTAGTFPTKLTERHGYDVDGTAQYFNIDKSAMADCYTNNAISYIALVTPETLSQSYPSIFAVSKTSTEKHLFIIKYNTAGNTDDMSVILNIDGVRRDSHSNIRIQDGLTTTAGFSWDGENVKIFLGGKLVYTNTAYSGNLTDLDSNITLGREISYYYKGKMGTGELFSQALTPMQVKDLHARLMKKVNKK